MSNDRLEKAENVIREQTALYRHYAISEVQVCVSQFGHVDISSEEAINIVQKIRNEKSMGVIDHFNLPDFVEEDTYPDLGEGNISTLY